MSKMAALDQLDAQLLLALAEHPRATTLALAQTTGAARNTVQARLNRFETGGILRSFERRIDPAALGYPMTAFISITVHQQSLDQVGDALARIPEVLEVFGLSGTVDLLARVVARDADDLYRIAGQILATPGIERTEAALAMRHMVDYRVSPLLTRVVR
ncbi:DNA-binding Lrp family transcriptional regulator [Micromonospora sp. HB375]|uniref:Lrp/AsnC family transcriptional regulator n=2 Tax=Micromonospora TaxID=1873 RepID=UPI001AE8FBFE|nr:MULTISPECIES: Lrp/AsnC family transcriptional regulator [unclassified Micromonospora]MBP1782047.1 DNA-binding Lrp family transcriptional regulator [Micromonospora sp. HB375]MDH6470878.1 DNA-binding Lrp family transcriptional regulator [Micromonospora sp. H404/HB375]